jgi:hypothetical protein
MLTQATRCGKLLNMMNDHKGGTMTVSKGDTVRMLNGAFSNDIGFVHYILPDGEAMVEHKFGRVYIHVGNLERVEL